MSRWSSLEARIRKAVRNKLKYSADGIATVYLAMWVDSSGDIIYWEEPVIHRIEPTSTALADVMKYTVERMRKG